MSILLDQDSKVLVQGITGRDGSFHAKQMLEYGTNVVAGVTPGKGGQQEHGIGVFNSVAEAKEQTQANTAVIYVPAQFAKGAILEDIDSGVLSIEAAKLKEVDELSKLAARDKRERFKLSLTAYHKDLSSRVKTGAITVEDAKEEESPSPKS